MAGEVSRGENPHVRKLLSLNGGIWYRNFGEPAVREAFRRFQDGPQAASGQIESDGKITGTDPVTED